MHFEIQKIMSELFLSQSQMDQKYKRRLLIKAKKIMRNFHLKLSLDLFE